MAYGINNDAELALLQHYFDAETTVFGLYNDATDNLTDTESESDISTEPTGSNYNRADVATGDASVTIQNGSANLNLKTKTFNVGNSSQDIDSAFLYNAADDFFLRLGVDTSSYPNDYIPLAELDNLRIGGNALTLE